MIFCYAPPIEKASLKDSLQLLTQLAHKKHKVSRAKFQFVRDINKEEQRVFLLTTQFYKD